MEDRREIGRVVRLQVQTSSLKAGPPKGRYYDPAPLREVDWLDLDDNGAVSVINGERVIDVHNASHPETKNREGINPISVGFTSHDDRMRAYFEHDLANGIAGENILVESDDVVTLDESDGWLSIEGSDGRLIELTRVSVAHPCVEFSRFALGDPAAHPQAVSATLRFLDNGMRGYYVAVTSTTPQRVQRGDRIFAIRSRRSM